MRNNSKQARKGRREAALVRLEASHYADHLNERGTHWAPTPEKKWQDRKDTEIATLKERLGV